MEPGLYGALAGAPGRWLRPDSLERQQAKAELIQLSHAVEDYGRAKAERRRVIQEHQAAQKRAQIGVPAPTSSVISRAPVDAGEPAKCLVSHGPVLSCPTSRHDACRNLYGRSRARLPTGHPSWPTCRGTGLKLVLVARVRNWSLPTGRLARSAYTGTDRALPDIGAQFGWWAQSGCWMRFQAMRCDTGRPSRVIRLSTAQLTRASVFWAGSVRARRPRPMTVL